MTQPLDEAEIERIRQARPELDARFGEYENVKGSMLGLKLRRGEPIERAVFTLFVATKEPLESLPKRQRIPRRVTIGGEVFHTDVLAVSSLMFQNGVFPEGTLTTFDGASYGTMTAFAASHFGVFGVTCAHAIKGRDGDPYTPTQVGVRSPGLAQDVPVGTSAYVVTGPGLGVRGDFGFMDIGIFTLEDDELPGRARNGREIPLGSPRNNERVRGIGTTGPKSGLIVGTEGQVDDLLVDVAISVDPPGTYAGDSGMLWVNQDGVAVAIHAMGDGNGPGVPSRFTAGMSASRAARALGLSFLQA